MTSTTSPAPAAAGAARPADFRLVTAVLLLGSGAAHLPVLQEHLREAAWMGYLFAAFALACAVLAAVLALSGSRIPQFAAGALCVLAVLTYAATRIVAFPQLDDDVGNWGEPWGVVSITLETLGAVSAFRLALRPAGRTAP